MKPKHYVMFCGKIVGQMPDDTVGIFDSVYDYNQAYDAAKKAFEDELADYLYQLENEYEMDDLQNETWSVTA